MIKTALVVTSVAPPTEAMQKLSAGARHNGYIFYCIGDHKSPDAYHLEGCQFVPLEEQQKSVFELGRKTRIGHYARKNIGYLMAIADGMQCIIETDDDNEPLAPFWEPSKSEIEGRTIKKNGWINVYAYFTKQIVWPRGYPLECIHPSQSAEINTEAGKACCPIQQGLVNGDPDVDAVYRLTRKLPIEFESASTVILEPGTWSPFNSQNTIWHKQAFPLMYLPSGCSFRMTDIWRSFVAQICLWANDQRLAFRAPTAYQARNEHNLLNDFEDEISGYLHNDRIINRFSELQMLPGEENIFANMKKCYSELIAMGLVDGEEIYLLEAWERDYRNAKDQ